MLRRLAALSLALFASTLPAFAADAVTVGVHVASVHIPARSYQNNFNPGLYVAAPSGWTAGVYYNTVHKVSVYAGYRVDLRYVDVMVGAVTGYKEAFGHSVVPLVAVSRSFDIGTAWRPRVTYIPKSTPKTTHLVHLSFETSI